MCVKFENEKKKEQKFFVFPERGFEPQYFSNFPAHDLNFNRKLGRWVKSKKAYKRVRGLVL